MGGCRGCRSWHLRLLSRNSGPQTELELCLCGTEEGLVDLGLIGVERDVRTSRIGVTLEYDQLIVLDLEYGSELYGGDIVSIELLLQLYVARQAKGSSLPAHPRELYGDDEPSQGVHELQGPLGAA